MGERDRVLRDGLDKAREDIEGVFSLAERFVGALDVLRGRRRAAPHVEQVPAQPPTVRAIVVPPHETKPTKR